MPDMEKCAASELGFKEVTPLVSKALEIARYAHEGQVIAGRSIGKERWEEEDIPVNIVSICGVPSAEWKDGACKCMMSKCSIDDGIVVSEKAYDYCKKKGLLQGTQFSTEHLLQKLGNSRIYNSVPKYVRAELTRVRLTNKKLNRDTEPVKVFEKLSEVPVNTMFVVIDSKTPTIDVGALVWRSGTYAGHPKLDGLNVAQEAACLDAEFCSDVVPKLTLERCYYRTCDESVW